ncbi:SIMPL domain-containing protein [Cryomorphaceae bacterium 1068]|nr:SIMPL domain-containing protein [Cryomorphaceae bacterium 1068]
MKNLLLFSTALFLFAFAEAQTSTIRVKGEATVKAIPALMNVNIPLQAKKETYEATSNDLTKTFNELTSALVKAGINEDDIKSNSMSINPEYRYMNQDKQLLGYVGSIRVSIELEHTQENMNAVVNTLKKEAFNFGYSLSFSLSETQKSTLLEEALTKAVKDGEHKADILAEALEVKIVALEEVNHGYMSDGPDVFQPRFRSMDAVEMKSDGGQEITLNPSEMEIRKEVGLIWKVAK